MSKIKHFNFTDPFEGTPHINAPAIYGASPNKPFLYKIPVTGKRPIAYSVEGALPEGLQLNSETGILSGKAKKTGTDTLTLHAENSLGKDSKIFKIKIAPDTICRTPLMGFTSWNANGNSVTQESMIQSAELLVESGLAEYGYCYVNLDSGWQGEYGGAYGAVMPNKKFPDMKAMCEKMHELGLKAGIYSTPMLKAWGGGEYPGCTTAPLDPAYPTAFFGIGRTHKEKNHVCQWEEYGFDYLKYDWDPCDVTNASIMRKCLSESSRDFAYSVTVRAGIKDAEYWKNNCTSWRDNPDSLDNWQRFCELFEADQWSKHCHEGHFFDLDMLETSSLQNRPNRLTEDEQLAAFSARAIFPSPIQISCDLATLTPFDFSMYCNEEIIAVNQDALCVGAVCIADEKSFDSNYVIKKHIKIYKKPLEDGGVAIGCFNLGETEETVTVPLENRTAVRDLWAKENLGDFEVEIPLQLQPHTVRMFKCKATK